MPSRASWCLLCAWLAPGVLIAPTIGYRTALAATAPTQATGERVHFDAIRKPPIPVSFLSHESSWVTFLYPPSVRDRIASLFALADDWRVELAEVLGRPPLTGLEVRIARGPEEMALLSPPELPPAEGASGVSYPTIRFIVLSSGTASAAYGKVDLAESFRRHLARVALHEAVAGQSLPDWVAAGLAVHLVDHRHWEHDWLLLRTGLRRDWVPLFETSGLAPESSRRNLHELALAAAEGEDFIAHLLALGRPRFPTAIEALRQGKDLPTALQEGYGSDASTLESQWRRQLARRMTVAVVASVLAVPVLAFLVMFGVRSILRRRLRKRGAAASTAAQRRRGAAALASGRARVHIVLSRRDDGPTPPPPDVQSDVPKVEHEGEWHTLH